MIRPEETTDHRAVFAVHHAAFPTPAEATLVDALRAAGRATLSLVEVVDGAVVGHVLFSPVTVAGGESGGLGLAPVAVLPAFQNQGIGGRLIRAGLAAVARDFRYCVVLGEPAYYRRFGFAHARPLGLENEYGADEPFMALELVPGGLAGVAGMVRYAPEFALV